MLGESASEARLIAMRIGQPANALPVTPQGTVLDYFAERIALAWAEGRRICALDCTGFEEGEKLVGRDLTNVTLVARDAGVLARLSALHCRQIVTVRSTPLAFLRRCRRLGETFDLVYLLCAAHEPDRDLGSIIEALAAIVSHSGEVLLTCRSRDVRRGTRSLGGTVPEVATTDPGCWEGAVLSLPADPERQILRLVRVRC